MRKNGFVIMWQLLKLVTPLAHIMAFTIIMGVLARFPCTPQFFTNFDRTHCLGSGPWHLALS